MSIEVSTLRKNFSSKVLKICLWRHIILLISFKAREKAILNPNQLKDIWISTKELSMRIKGLSKGKICHKILRQKGCQEKHKKLFERRKTFQMLEVTVICKDILGLFMEMSSHSNVNFSQVILNTLKIYRKWILIKLWNFVK